MSWRDLERLQAVSKNRSVESVAVIGEKIFVYVSGYLERPIYKGVFISYSILEMKAVKIMDFVLI